MKDDRRHLQGQLDQLAVTGERFLARWYVRCDVRQSGSAALMWLLVGPLALVLTQIALRVSQRPTLQLTWWISAAVTLAGSVLYIIARVAWLRMTRHIPRRTALAQFDTQLDDQERLVTADQFLTAGDNTHTEQTHRFMQAAIDDAAPRVEAALATPLTPRPLAAWHIERRTWTSVPAAAALIALALWMGTPTGGIVPAEPEIVLAATDVDGLSTTHGARQLDAPRHRAARQQESATGVTNRQFRPRAETPSRFAPDDTLAEAQSQTGQPSSTRSSTNSSSASGEPSDQQSASRPHEEQEGQERLDEGAPPPPTKPAAKRPSPEPQAMSPTSGEGQSKVSSSHANNIPSEDQPDRAGAKKEDGDEDRDVQDEDEEEKTTGVERPSLGKNKPPVDRNLSPQPSGDEPNPMVNGRSGPGGQKKTRGVPAMILGVPIPDRIPGMKNPGRSKVTQESTAPKEERHDSMVAEHRQARHDPFGHVEHPRLLPWMQRVIERYFLDLREQATQPR